MFRIDLHDAKLLGGFHVDLERSNGEIGSDLAVVVDHLAIVHLVDVIPGEDQNLLGAFFLDLVDVLINGVGCPLVPLFIDPLLRRHNIDVFIQLTAKIVLPSRSIWRSNWSLYILRQDEQLSKSTVEAIREDKIDDAVDSTERDAGLARSRVNGSNRVPLPPARITANTSSS